LKHKDCLVCEWISLSKNVIIILNRQQKMKWTKLSERIIFIDNKNAVAERDKTAEYYSNGIKVRVIYPDSVNDTIRQQKINKMYDILLGATCRKESAENFDNPEHLPKAQ